MTLPVLLADDAIADIEDIHRYVARESRERAGRLVSRLQAVCARLGTFSDRGNLPPELHDLGITDYREAHLRPYRVIYRVFTDRVVIYAVADGRRDMQSFLERRLLR